MNIIEIKNLNFQYTKKDVAIKNVSLSIEKGEFVCILGHNGSGKSTLAKLIAGLLAAKSGEIYVNGILINEKTINEVRHNVGIVFQNPDNQFVGVTVKDDIAFGLENRQIEREEMLARIEKYAQLTNMSDFLEYNPENLSGGEKQRVAIAGVLACHPEVIIFDEATSMLDPKGVREVTAMINQLKGYKTIISITHNLQEALFADRVIVMNDGEIVLNDTPINVFKQKEILINSKLDILTSMKLITKINSEKGLKNKAEIEELLWQLTFEK
ncbi:MAG TPA: energy-coupling factor transporter ATPase [Bacilli bacterium]|jgi:energy-coupling factor transport system ATP-binding protein|nr:energy-coupling factor transporter ATPase [Acholeplasmataceae bacterium]HNZ77397.1 energy-coupling factor transporter ATPase [Bacilli bacterium]HOD61118.1 energy-coupling factor transporter ATPase [Bacilli bacterium]HOH61602.1 energy-coupling factor transporter ATPase [Bacilli bacterium]HPB48806.1 energy-coupling factor transporter ATPase [Bacilli bacterium]